MSVTDDLQRMTNVDALRFWIADGQLVKAAEWARDFARDASPDELRAIVAALADALETGGGKRAEGRSRNSDLVTRAYLLEKGFPKLRELNKASAKLAALHRAADAMKSPDTTTTLRRERIKRVLKRYGLVLDRSFATNARTAVAERYRLNERKL